MHIRLILANNLWLRMPWPWVFCAVLRFLLHLGSKVSDCSQRELPVHLTAAPSAREFKQSLEDIHLPICLQSLACLGDFSQSLEGIQRTQQQHGQDAILGASRRKRALRRRKFREMLEQAKKILKKADDGKRKDDDRKKDDYRKDDDDRDKGGLCESGGGCILGLDLGLRGPGGTLCPSAMPVCSDTGSGAALNHLESLLKLHHWPPLPWIGLACFI
ncbi:unnamed protein product [Symbiodinium microadriaticum]|nr:unnamed protein product [Symbiodinium microadriaticum]CAE7938858.1 unnamed protein product [Symbiodinium sp. KB8]